MSNPMRLCVACRQYKPKKSLIRVAADEQMGAVVDSKQKIQSRGAYVCRDRECISKAAGKHLFERALGTQIKGELFDRLREEADE